MRIFRTARRGITAASLGAAVAALVMVMAFGSAVMVPATPVSGHAYLERSQPEAGDVVEEPPEEVRLWFTEPLEEDHSFALLYDATGTEIETEGSRVSSEDRFEMVLPLPDDLPNGTYTVQWRNISAADGHPESGFFAFTIGSRDDITDPTAPSEDATTGNPGFIEPLGRWLSFLGITAAVGTVFVWLWAVRPALTVSNQSIIPSARRNARRLALTGLALAVLGAILGLTAQTIIVTRGLSISDLAETLFNTRYGMFWGLRLLQFGMLGVLLYGGALWRQTRVRRTGWLALAIALLALLPFSMTSHAAAQTVGTTVAIANDWLHLAAVSVWVGGLIAMMVAAIIPTRSLDPDDRRSVYAELIPRFSTMAIASVAILALSGIYSAWLQVGSLRGLQETDYGQMLGLKLLLTIPLLTLGAVNLLVISPWMRRAGAAGKHFGRTVAAEIVLAAAVLGVVALLVSMAPARNTLESEAQRTNFRFSQAGLDAALYISPGAVGQNRYTLDITPSDGELPAETEAQLRVSREGLLGGVRQIDLQPSGEDIGRRSVRYEATGTDLSVSGTWDLELVIFRPGAPDWRVERFIEVPEVPAQEQIPPPPPRFVGIQSIGAPIAIALAIVFGIVALRNRLSTEPDRVLGWLAVMLVVFSGLTIWQTRLDTTPTTQLQNPILMTASSVESGHHLYVENCQVCHGPDSTGDGPRASELSQRPADLTAAHVDIHPDGDLYWWISEGIDPAMPGFGDQLTDDEIWHLVNYVRSLRDPLDE